MKKFVIVMITLLVLFVFLMLNYLLWDKENLQKQSATDKAQQDWLLGQNKTYQATIDQQDQTISTLNKENNDYTAQVSNLQRLLDQANSTQYTLNAKVNAKDNAIAAYKLQMAEILKKYAQQWFDGVTNQDSGGTYAMLGEDYILFGDNYSKETYTEYIKAIKSISFIKQTEDEAKSNPDFAVIEGRGTEYEIYTRAAVEVVVTEDQKDKYKDLSEGLNRIEIGFRYDLDKNAWAIFSIMEAIE